jgi:quinate dehydrogenase
MHNHIATRLYLPWTFRNTECPTVADMMMILRSADFAGGVITMPYKKIVMEHLDALDDLTMILGACNNVYVGPKGELRGTNTD